MNIEKPNVLEKEDFQVSPLDENQKLIANDVNEIVRGINEIIDYVPNRGSLFITVNTTPTTFATSETYVPIVGTKQVIEDETELFNNGFDLNANVLRYTSEEPGWYAVYANMCFTMDTSNIQIRMRIAKNGTALARSCGRTSLTGTPTSGRAESLSTHTMVYLAQNDTLDIHVGNFTNTDQLIVTNMQLSAIYAGLENVS